VIKNMSRETRIYVGNLPGNINPRELDDLFYKYGNIRDIDLKNRRGTPFAFIDFEDYSGMIKRLEGTLEGDVDDVLRNHI